MALTKAQFDTVIKKLKKDNFPVLASLTYIKQMGMMYMRFTGVITPYNLTHNLL